MSNKIETTEDVEDTKKTAVALRLEKARQALANKRAKEDAAKEATKHSELVKEKAKVRGRKRLSHRGPLSVPTEHLENNKYMYRWVEDAGWNLGEKQELGYEFVQDADDKFRDRSMVIEHAKFGNIVGRPADRGGKYSQYLMRIDKDLYDDAKAQEKTEREERVENTRRANRSQRDFYEKKFTSDFDNQDIK